MSAIIKTGLVEKLTELSEQAASGTGIEISEVQLRGAGKARLLRVYIDKPGGVTHGDCELVSERLGRLLDEQDVIPGEGYTLEVSSPGVERKLSKPRDFERVVGEKVRVVVHEPIEGSVRFEGKLTGFQDQELKIELGDAHVVKVPLDKVRKANLKFDW
jgi:ribosome maturation factor RimP